MSIEDEIGAVSLRVEAPALSSQAYMDLQQQIWSVLKPRSRGRFWRNMLLAVVIGIGLGLVPAWLGMQAELWIAFTRLGFEAYLEDSSFLLLMLLTALVPAALAWGWYVFRQVQALHVIHARSGELFAAHEVLFGEQALLWRNAHRTTVIRWASFTALRRGHQQWLLMADHASALWFPDEAVAAGPGEAELLAQIERYTGLKPSQKTR